MYNPDESDIDLIREYSPEDFALNSRYKLNRYREAEMWYSNIATEHRRILFAAGVKCKYLRYAGVDDNQTLDLFYKEDSVGKPSPLFVFLHAGNWCFGNKELYVSMVGPLVKSGHRVAIVDYNKREYVTVTQQMEQIYDLATWIFQYADRTQTTDITFAGHGHGAHLLTQLLHIPGSIPDGSRPKVKSMFFIAGFYDCREMQTLTGQWVSTGLDEDNAIDVSPILWSWKEEAQMWRSLEVHVLTVEHTSVTLQQQSQQFSQVLEAAGFRTTFKEFDGLDHFTIILDQNIENSEITNYIKTAMKKVASSSKENRPCLCGY